MGDQPQVPGRGEEGLSPAASAGVSAGTPPAAAVVARPGIAALATAPGRGGIGVVRVSGADLAPLIEALIGRALVPRQATYAAFRAADGATIDRGVAIHFPAPHSYTGEDVLELQGHGGPVVLRMLLERVLEAGRTGAAGTEIRLARPGEFTERAFLNDKLDLAQAEAVADLIDASTEQAARSATRSLEGEFSRAVGALVDALVDLRMLVEATLDFPEEEIDFLAGSDARGQLAALRTRLDATIDQARQGALLREGLNVVLAGAPNVGKSSLLNALAGAEVAIVTAIPGTTRDKVTQPIQLNGVPLNIIDTAGLRDSDDEVERIGIARAWEEVDRADVVLHLRDVRETAATAGSEERADAGLQARLAGALVARLRPHVPVIDVWNKIDLCQIPAHAEGTRAVWLSAKTRVGIAGLRGALLATAGWHGSGESTFLARARHLEALSAAREHLAQADDHARAGAQRLELLAEELRGAQQRLGEITGAFSADDLLGVIFSRFCIGK
ncbi:MAG: tRNA uridine-5-carboxymethylaminomethyl(34) synthesis GTPase MnmE [Burkholderiaceae bacterium]|nr:tRNA uridine-5-carboxymethylaminomethyl(34) synthesis GTPase MnmE [Burkholderiaceae bacterium]